MALATPGDTAEKAEFSLEERRDMVWDRFLSLIISQPKVRIQLIPGFAEALHNFASAHLDVLVDQHHHDEEVEPYEFIREKLLRIKSKVDSDKQKDIFSQIRTVLTNEAAMRMIDVAKVYCLQENQIRIFFNVAREYVALCKLHTSDLSKVEKLQIHLSVALANRLVFQASESTLCADPYRHLSEELGRVLGDTIETEMAVASIAHRVTRILIADLAERTEKKPRIVREKPAVIPDHVTMLVEEKVAVQMHKGRYDKYIVFMTQAKADDAVRKGEGAIVEVPQKGK